MTFSHPGARELAGKRIAVVGLGKSGQACLHALSDLTTAVLSAWDADLAALAKVAGIGLETGGSDPDNRVLAEKVIAWHPDVIIPAPAIAEVGPLFELARDEGIELWSEIELAWRLRAADESGSFAPWLCVTGTNGKTTTVSMVAAMLKQAGLGGLPIGNVGNPAVTETSRIGADAARVFVLELSSFQLTTTYSVSPLASVCLNFADDHLEWHGTRDAYWAAKAKVYEHNQIACIYPVGDKTVQTMVDGADVIEGSRAIGITLGIPEVGSVGIVEGEVVDRAFCRDRFSEAVPLFALTDIEHLAPSGTDLPSHIVTDAMTAAALARAAGVSAEDICEALRHFEAGHHRIELIATVDDVRYVDDSKATNAHAAAASISAQADGSVVWVAGGVAKGSRFEALVEWVSPKLRGVVVIGTDQSPWRDALAQVEVPVCWVDTESMTPMADAVELARGLARPGDSVVLAPASSSFDQFSSYADRGIAFAAAVRNLHG